MSRQLIGLFLKLSILKSFGSDVVSLFLKQITVGAYEATGAKL